MSREEIDIHFDDSDLRKELRRIEHKEDEILELLRERNRPVSIQIHQLNHEGRMSTPAGGTSVFQEVPTPAGSVFPSGTTFQWTVDDTADITLAPSPDGTQVTATCVATPAQTSYNLTCTSSYTPPGAPTPVSGTVNVQILVTPPAPTGIQINQLS